MLSASFLAAARVLAVDRVTAEVAFALQKAGVDHLVLKGPALARALYDEAEVRRYADTDVLVPQRHRPLAIAVLQDAGFKVPPPAAYRDRIEPHGIHLRRERDGANVDLHRTIPLVRAHPTEVWAALSEDAGMLRLSGADVPVPAPPGLAFHVAVHAVHHGTSAGHVHEDLRRAVERFDRDTWAAARDLAERLDGLDAFARGLAFDPRGAALARELCPDAPASSDVALAAQSPPVTARGWHRLLGAEDRMERLRAIRTAIMPPPDYIRLWWGYRSRPRAPLPAMYLWRMAHLLKDAPSAIAAVRRARREAAGASRGDG